jgi:7,8-dihydropterin-6-yl-methyl-4-(beta-D-ribofuranosyl)aminobenzene 5'-phosphate synthase
MHLPARIGTFVLLTIVGIAAPVRGEQAGAAQDRRPVTDLKVTVLSTMLADDGIGEWGFSALVEVNGSRLLFDTGARPETVLQNAKELGIDLAGITDVILSHFHADHTGGLVTLRKALAVRDPKSLSRIHVGEGIFWSRPGANGKEGNPVLAMRPGLESSGAQFIVHKGPEEILPGVWLTGPVPRVHPERNFTANRQVQSPTGLVEDNVPEDMSLVFDTTKGLVLLSGCGHAGIVNTVDYARKVVRPSPMTAVLGGFHLLEASDEALTWTATQLKSAGIGWILGAHCTGIEAVHQLREQSGLSRRTCVVGAVGASFSLDDGIDPGRIAR